MMMAGAAYLPPTSYPNLTVWLDFTDIATLFQNNAGTTPVTADGQPLRSVVNKAGGGRPNWVILNDSAVDNTYQTNEVNGKSVIQFAGGQLNYLYPSSSPALSNYLGASAKTLTLAFKYTGSPPVTSPIYTGHAIFGGRRNEYFGLYLTSTYRPAGYNWDGNTDATASLGLASGTYGVAQLRHNGTTLQARLNSGAWQSVASGATTVMSGTMILGLEGTTGLMSAHFAHAVAHSSVLSDADADAERDWAMNQIGLL